MTRLTDASAGTAFSSSRVVPISPPVLSVHLVVPLVEQTLRDPSLADRLEFDKRLLRDCLFNLNNPSQAYRLASAIKQRCAKIGEDRWHADFERPVLVSLRQPIRQHDGLAQFRTVTMHGPEGTRRIIPELDNVSSYSLKKMRAGSNAILTLCREFTICREEPDLFRVTMHCRTPLNITCHALPAPESMQ